jgi:hypothetical protein
MKPKIIIAINGGLVAAVATNLPECEVVVVDFDLQAHEDGPVLVPPPRAQDDTFEDGKAYLFFDADKAHEAEAADQLKKLNY